MRVVQVFADNVLKKWSTCYPWLEDIIARSHGEMEVGDILLEIQSQRMQVWIVVDESDSNWKAICLTTVVSYPRFDVVNVVGLAGSGMALWQGLLQDTLRQFARNMNCERIEATCRPGFARKLKAMGVKQLYAKIALEV